MRKSKLFGGLLYGGLVLLLCYLALENQQRLGDAWTVAGHAPADYALDVISSESIRFYAQTPQPEGFATAMRRMQAASLRGKRVRLTGYVTTSQLAEDAALWMRVDGPNGRMLALDNMDDRLIVSDVERRRCAVVLDVPQEGQYVLFGAILGGGGELFLEEVRLEVVDETVPTTNLLNGA